MAQVMVNFRMDDVLKKSLEAVCKEMGMSVTTAFTIFATKVARERRIPFDITADPFYSKSNIDFLKEAYKQEPKLFFNIFSPLVIIDCHTASKLRLPLLLFSSNPSIPLS